MKEIPLDLWVLYISHLEGCLTNGAYYHSAFPSLLNNHSTSHSHLWPSSLCTAMHDYVCCNKKNTYSCMFMNTKEIYCSKRQCGGSFFRTSFRTSTQGVTLDGKSCFASTTHWRGMWDQAQPVAGTSHALFHGLAQGPWKCQNTRRLHYGHTRDTLYQSSEVLFTYFGMALAITSKT